MMEKIVFFGGKGGVGKTTCSSAFALQSAKSGKKTLLISTDPAHSISDIFERPIGLEIVNLRENLDGLEIDSDYESEKYISGIRKNLHNILSPVIVEEINRQLDAASVSPGTQESAMFDKMIEIINEKSSEYDQIIFDTAPTGHTIRLLSLPELLGEWMESLMKKRRKALKLKQMTNNIKGDRENITESDPILETLGRRKDNMEKARKIIIDEDRLSFVFVLNAEKLPIEETKKAIKVLEKYNLKINNLIVNRILPESVQDTFWKNKKISEKKYLDEIYTTFEGKKIIKLPLLQDDMRVSNIDDMAKKFEGVFE